jgi:hypothetical protein
VEEFVNIALFIQSYVGALNKALDNTARMLPGLARQHIETQAKEKLSTSMDNYVEALSVKMEDYVLIMEIDKDNWLACAVEEGAKAWDMTESHLKNSKKTKTSKEGYKYMSIPIGKEAGGKAGPSKKSEEIQKKINEVMKRPRIQVNKMGMPSNKLFTSMGGKLVPGVFQGGSITQTQQIDTGGDPDISGLYRSRVFSNADEYHQKMENKKGMPKWQLVMFRTISNNPNSKHWFHPGINGVNILKETDQWLWGTVTTVFEKQIQEELQRIGVG